MSFKYITHLLPTINLNILLSIGHGCRTIKHKILDMIQRSLLYNFTCYDVNLLRKIGIYLTGKSLS